MNKGTTRGKLVVKNTLFLYVRMLCVLFISLFTSRIVLRNLGVVDFGIYNVVAAVVTLFAFLNTSLSVSVQRFLSYEIGANNILKVKTTFRSSIIVYLLIALLLLLIVEPVGYYLIEHKLSIPENRHDVAFDVFHMSLIMLVISVLRSPFVALLTSCEKFNYIAFIAIIESVLKLLSAALIIKFSTDNLITYSVLLVVSTIIVSAIYISVSIWNNKEIVCQNYFKNISWGNIKEISFFSFWNMFSSLALVCLNQGLNILLNIFFNPIVNAARAVSIQINSAAYSFISNVHSAVVPQLAKSYAQNDMVYLRKLSVFGCKISYSLFLILFIPLFFYSDYILHLWLDEVPQYTSIFVRLTLLNTLIDPIGGIVSGVAQASGQVRKYQFVVGLAYMLTIPLAYVALRIFNIPEIVFIVNILITILCLLYRLNYLKFALYFPKNFMSVFMLRVVLLIVTSLLINYFISLYFSINLVGFLLYSIITLIINASLLIFIMFSKEERIYALQYIKKSINK